MPVLSSTILQWSVSFYNPENKKWKDGTLLLKTDGISFIDTPYTKILAANFVKFVNCVDDDDVDDHVSDSTDNASRVSVSDNVNNIESFTKPTGLALQFSDITGIRKATSCFVYPCLVISHVNKVHYWFSALPNRDAVYNIIEHFWRDTLIEDTQAVSRGVNFEQGVTQMGQKLLKIATNSETLLQEAGTTLKEQGEQLTRSAFKLQEIHENLDTSERFISGIEKLAWTMDEYEYPYCGYGSISVDQF